MQEISTDELFEKSKNIEEGELLLDVRGPDEFAEGHIRGALNIPHIDISERIDELKGYKTIYVFCRMGPRAQMAADDLIDAGIDKVICLARGGMAEWQGKGLDVER